MRSSSWRQEDLIHRRDRPNNDRPPLPDSNTPSPYNKYQKKTSNLQRATLLIILTILTLTPILLLLRKSQPYKQPRQTPPIHQQPTQATFIKTPPTLHLTIPPTNNPYLYLPNNPYHILHTQFPDQTLPTTFYSLPINTLRQLLSSYNYRSFYKTLNFTHFSQIPDDYVVRGSLVDVSGFEKVDVVGSAAAVEPYQWKMNVDVAEEVWWVVGMVKFIWCGDVVRDGDVGLWNGRGVLLWGEGKGGGGSAEVAWDILRAGAKGRRCLGGSRFWKKVVGIAEVEEVVRERATRAFGEFGKDCATR